MLPIADAATSVTPRLRSIGVRSWIVRGALGGCAAAGVFGLTVMTGAGTTEVAIARALPSLQAAWLAPTSGAPAVAGNGGLQSAVAAAADQRREASAVVLNAAGSGDEGFWLSSAALAGNSGQTLAMGDPITMGDRRYVVTELTPLAAGAAGTGKESAGRGAHALTLVVASEVSAEPAQASPRRLRFLVDSLPSEPKTAPAERGQTAQGSL